MRKIAFFFLGVIAVIIFFGTHVTHAQVFNQNQIVITPYGGWVNATSTSGGSKLNASTTPYFANFFAGNGTINNLSYFNQNWVIRDGILVPTTTIQVVVGTTSLPYDLLVNDLFRAATSTDDFTDIGVSNYSTGACATAEFDALNKNSTLTNHFSAFGITGSGFTGIGCPNTPYTDFGPSATYILNPNGDINFALGTSSSDGEYRFFGGGYGNTNRLLTLTQPGFVGLGTNIPDSPLTINNTGATQTFIAPQTGTMIHMVSAGSVNSRIVGDVYTNATANGFALQGRKARTGVGSPSAPNADDTLVLLGGNGYGTSAFPSNSTGAIAIRAETSNFTNTSQPTYIVGLTARNGTLTPLEGFRLTSTGRFGIGSSSPFALLGIEASQNASSTSNLIFNIGSSTAAGARTSVFSVSNTGSTTLFRIPSSLLKTDANGAIVRAVPGTDYQTFAYPFPNNATTSSLTLGGATTTGTLYVMSSTTLGTALSGAGLTNCNGTNFLQWTSGTFGCGAGSAGGSYPFTPITSFNTTTSATTSPIWGIMGIFASSTSRMHQLQVGSSSPTAAGYTNAPFIVTGNVNSYVQTITQNINSFENASACSVLSHASSTNSTYYGETCINGPSYAQAAFSSQNAGDVSFLASDGAIVISTASTTNAIADIRFTTGGTASSSIRAIIKQSGLFGVGTTSPSALLSIHAASTTGSLSPLTLFAVASSTGGLSTTTLFRIDNRGQLVNTNISSSSLPLTGVVSPGLVASFTYATSTAWTGTTTIPLEQIILPLKHNGISCKTDAGTLNVNIYSTSTVSGTFVNGQLLNASTTNNLNIFSVNNTFPFRASVSVDIGTPASSPTKINCTVLKTLTPQ